MTNLICICCPKGCHLSVDEKNNFSVTGNSCPRGAEYGKSEVTHPVRVVTHTVKTTSSEHPRLSVKTNAPIPKEKIFDIIDALNKTEISPPVKIGDIIIKNVCETNSDIVATGDIL